MSLMESLRSGRDSTLVQLVLAAVIVSFVAFGAGGGFSGADAVARVNGEPISAFDYENAVRNAEDRQRRQGPLSEDERAAIRQQVLQQLIEARALAQEAERLGLQVSDAEIAEQLLQIPWLLDSDGRFDLRAYQNFLRQQGLTRGSFEERIREDLLVRKLNTLMILGVSVSEPMIERRYVDENTKVDLQYVRILPSRFAAAYEPTPDEVATYLAEHESEVRAQYDRDFTRRYDLPERVDLRLIRLPVTSDGLGVADLKQKLVPVKEQLDQGADFTELALRWSEDPSVAQGGLVEGVRLDDLDDPVVAALRNLQPGQHSDVIVTTRDVRIVRLEAREPARQIPFDEVKEDIARALLKDAEGPVRARAFARDELLPAWTSAGAPPEDLLAARDLRVQSTGPIPLSQEAAGLFRPPVAMLDAARTADAGTVLPEVYEEDGVLWVGAVASRQDADMAAYEGERDKYRELALLMRRSEFFEAWKDEVVARARVQR